MRIMFYGTCFPPAPYGASRYLGNLSRALTRCGHEVVVVTAQADGLPDREECDGVRVHRIGPARHMRTAAAAAAALRIARDAGSELVQGVDYLGECAPLLCRPVRPPVCIKAVTSMSLRAFRHSLAPHPWQRLMVTLACLRAWRQWRAEWVSIRYADLLFAPTQRVFSEFERQGMRMPAIRGVVPNPVDIPKDWENVEAAAPTVLFVGRLDFGKGVACLPAILKAVRTRIPDARLVVAGGDSYSRGIGSIRKWLVRRFGDDVDGVSFRGNLDPAVLDACYRQAWVVVVPSRWDSCSNVTLEAMARAKAVVVSPHGGMSELVADTDAPVVDPAKPGFVDAVVSLLEDQRARTRLGQALRERAAQRYNPERVVALYIDFISRPPACRTEQA